MAHLELRLQRDYGLTRQQAREVIQSCTKRRMRRSPWLIGLAVAMLAALLMTWWSHTWAPMRLFAPVMLPMVIAIQHAGARAAEPDILAEAARLQRDSRRLDEDFATLQQAMKTRAHADPLNSTMTRKPGIHRAFPQHETPHLSPTAPPPH